ncbi:hypothetical protein HanRHA438_Chr17g0808581 [Helianthus annuus]|nr:hypothetical protein HanRHA438_Chr17g0808581 [Helianthus annuus]
MPFWSLTCRVFRVNLATGSKRIFTYCEGRSMILQRITRSWIQSC